jgi:tetratricopeptide (TPR) repeat protein
MVQRLAVIILMALATCLVSASQTATTPTLKEANALLAASKNEEAATAFLSLIHADGGNLNAWLGFGQTQENLGQTEKALAAYSKVIELSSTPVFQTRMAMVSIAGIYAVKGDRETAYEWLIKLADSHPAPAFLAIVGGAKEFASLKEEPRFKQALEQIKPCNSFEYHQFDFWVGSWEVQNPQGQTLGHNDVNRIVGGCIVQENWASLRVSESGTSFNFYDYRDKKWHQDYYDNSGNMGNFPPLAGELRDGKMVLLSAPGVRPLSRWTWYEIAPGKVRQMAEQSSDSGKTWLTTWDSIYVRK